MCNTSGLTIFDFHSDIPADIVARRASGEHAVFQNRHARRLMDHGVKAAILALWVEPAYRANAARRILQIAGALLADLAESTACVQLVTDVNELLDCIASGKFAVMLGVEGMTFIEQWPVFHDGWRPTSLGLQFDQLRNEQCAQSLGILKALGLRHAILVWGGQNELASGPGQFYDPDARQGLTDFGRAVVQACERSNIVIDVSHLDEASTTDVLEATEGVVIASHSNARALCNHPRNLSDAHLRRIGERQGVVGINSYARFVDADHATVDRFIDHIVYIADLIGIEHVGLGFDFMDYLPDSFGFPERTDGLARVEDVPRLIERLYARGFNDEEIAMLTFRNAARVMSRPNVQ
ncbi:dipeptidase [Alicyclobacillus kakegawensis]|uniref:dipeptidase n=1 Tax=Alicyclobacillus kakegawensis TaxID=392012 RepID=UPI00082C52A3|nr:membrane dipeptidase [Alicyclobacillus kakegawensis]